MSEIRFITSSDEHLCDQNVGFRIDNYRDSILSKLEWQGKFASGFRANALLRGGDLFHVKASNKTTMRTLSALADIHNSYECKTYSVCGNHDMSYNDLSTIPGQPLGVLYASGVFQTLKEQYFESGSLSARVVGVDYTIDFNFDSFKEKIKKKTENYTIAIVHALAAMAPEERIQSFFNEPILDYRDLVFEGCPDVYVFGHFHKDQGVVDHLGVKFVNLGAVSRGALTFENLERKPKISSIKIDSRGVHVEEHVIPHEDASKIFDLEKKKRMDKERRNLDDFINSLRKNVMVSSSNPVDSLKEELSKFPEDLKKLAFEVIESAEAGVLDD